MCDGRLNAFAIYRSVYSVEIMQQHLELYKCMEFEFHYATASFCLEKRPIFRVQKKTIYPTKLKQAGYAQQVPNRSNKENQ